MCLLGEVNVMLVWQNGATERRKEKPALSEWYAPTSGNSDALKPVVRFGPMLKLYAACVWTSRIWNRYSTVNGSRDG